MVNFVASPAVNPGVNTQLFGGQPVRIWTPGVPLLSPRNQEYRAAGERGGEAATASLPPPPPPPARFTLPGCAPIVSCPANAWTADSMSSGLSSPMARNVNAIMAAVNGTKNKKRVTFLNESAPTGNRNLASASSQQKRVQDRKIERRPVRNPYRKTENQKRRKVFGARLSKASASGKSNVWNFPTKIDEFKKPEVEEIFNDFWKSVDDHEVEQYFKDFWKCVNKSNDQMEHHFLEFWKSVGQSQDCHVDISDFWRRVENGNRKQLPKENLAAHFWKMIESQKEKELDEAAVAGQFLKMAQKSESLTREVCPWETPARDLWKLIQHEERSAKEKKNTPETLAGEFFRMTSSEQMKTRSLQTANDAELMSGQFWRMVQKQTDAGKEVKFVADEAGNVFRNIKGHEMKAKRRESMIEARLANEFFNMVENQEGQEEESITFTADSIGNIYKGSTIKKIPKSVKLASEATMVNDFFKMIEKEQKHNDAKVECFAGNFWKMINNSEGRPEDRRGKETWAGEFWKTVEFMENLKVKRETMRRLSASRREEAESSAVPLFAAAKPAIAKDLASTQKEVARKAAMLYACSSLEQQQHQQQARIAEKPAGRHRTLSSSSSLFAVEEEEEEEEPRVSSRRTYKVAPNYNALQLGAPANNVTGAILVALRHKKKTEKPQQCHRQNMVAQERRGCVTRRNRIPSISNGANNDRKCGKRAW